MFGSKLEVRRFENRIEKYESVPIQEGKILFYGHSLFTRCSWITNFQENPKLEDCVRMKDGSQAIVNHGFGTSSADDLLYYYDRMVRPWKPRALVLATESNDVGFGYSATEVMEILARIIQWAKADFPDIRIYCFNDEPTLKSKGQVTVGTRMRKEYNELLKAFCAVTENCIYVPMEKQAMFFENPEDIGDYDKIREDIFHEDNTHLNPMGYGLFMDFVRELLDDLL
jgi:lysophospholipase L1-like esterase